MTQLTSWVHRYSQRDLMDDSFDLFKEKVVTLLMAGAIPYILVVAYTAIMRLYVLPGNFIRDFSTPEIGSLLENGDFWLFLFGLMLVSCIAFAISLIVQSRVAIAHTFGETVSLGKVFRGAFVPALRLLGVGIIYNIFLSAVTSFAFFVAGCITLLIALLGTAIGAMSDSAEFSVVISVIVFVIWYIIIVLATALVSALFIATPAFLAHERSGVFASIGRSFRFASPNYKANVFVLTVLMHVPMIFLLLASGLLALLIYGLSFTAPSVAGMVGLTLIWLITSLAFSAVIACQSALTYLDGMCRLEALDLRLMAQEIGLQDEIEQVFRPRGPQPMATYPAYGSLPPTPGAAVVNYASPPAMTRQRSALPQAVLGFPNYAAPPPALEAEIAAVKDEPCESAASVEPEGARVEAPLQIITMDVPAITEDANAE